jgi:colanic acid biosynthesis glycosyl transferase WcaI
MRVLIANPAYRPSTGAITERVSELAEYLAAAGHKVHVLCWKGETPALANQTIEGVEISRIGGARPGFLGGLVLAWRLMLAAMSRRFDADVVITVAPPMPLAWFGRLHALRRGGRSAHVAWVLDLETQRTTDEKHQWASRARKVARELLFAPIRDASLVLSIGRCMRETLAASGVAPDRIRVIPLWSNRRLIEPIKREASRFAVDPELRDKFIAMYSGRAARWHDMQTICEAMALLRDDADVAFVLAATDVGASNVEQYAAAHRLPNLYRRSSVGLQDLGAFLGGADVHLVTLKNEMLGTCVPSKTYGAFAAGRPVIFVGPQNCEAALNVTEQAAGRVVRVGDAAALASQIREWKTRGQSYAEACENALRAFNASHCVEVGCGAMAALMLECVERHAAAPRRVSAEKAQASKRPVF